MKKIYSLFAAAVFSGSALAQIPAGYYNSATGLTGYTLKTALSQIITNGHIDKGYNGLWTAYQTTDRDYYYENNGKVLDMYSENPAGADPYEFTITASQCGSYSGEGSCYNREHTIPQSFFNSASPMHNDIHFIPPVDGKVNGMRSDYPYGNVATPTWTSLNGSKLGTNSTTGFSGTVFEPINEFKGDIARMIFYFVTRYQDKIPTFSSGNMLDGTTTRSLTQWELDVLLAWNDLDPVSQREIDRNNACYNWQGNRNPYIDHPEYVHQVWGYTNTTPDTVAPSIPTNISATNITGSSATATWTASTDNIAVSGYNIYINGVLYGSSGSTSINLSGLNPNTTYTVTVSAFDAAGNQSAQSSPANFTTTNTPAPIGNSNEILISEYVEGTANNKAIEIANFTPDSVDLSNYTIQKQANGAGSWVNSLALSGTLAPNSVYVITNSAAAFSCPFTSNQTVAGAPMDFNGNDPIGLFKNGTLVDIVGTLNNTANFAADTTLRRNVTNPSTTFAASQWTALAVNTCDNLGILNPATTLGTVEIYKNISAKISPNPVTDGVLHYYDNASARGEILDMAGNLVQVVENMKNSGEIKLRNVSAGVYILKTGSFSQKFIVK